MHEHYLPGFAEAVKQVGATVQVKGSTTMHTYRIKQGEGGNRLYVVGFFAETIGWHALKDVNSETEAMAWVSYLNGGDHPDKYLPPGELV